MPGRCRSKCGSGPTSWAGRSRRPWRPCQQSDRAAVTMTAELCDCYPTKAVGVNRGSRCRACRRSRRSIVVWGVDGEFHSVADARRQPHLAAAANWLALANLAARSIPESRGLLIDIGSTTTDLIPLDRGRWPREGEATPGVCRAASWFMRACAGRPCVHWRPSCRFEGSPPAWRPRSLPRRSTSISCWETSRPTRAIFHGRRPSRDCRSGARDRLARMVGADRDGFSLDDAIAFAKPPTNACSGTWHRRRNEPRRPTIGRPAPRWWPVLASSWPGGWLMCHRAEGPIVSLREAWGPVASSAGCAYALVKLASERFGSDGYASRDSRTGLTQGR